jgi:DNA-binding NarL/FixJ family response regulator
VPVPDKASIRVVLAGRSELVELLSDALRAPGIHILASCHDRGAALAAVRRESPDVCIVDRELDGGGLIAAAAVASPRPAPKVLVVGDQDAPAEKRAARLAGASAYLARSSDADTFLATVFQLGRSASS